MGIGAANVGDVAIVVGHRQRARGAAVDVRQQRIQTWHSATGCVGIQRWQSCHQRDQHWHKGVERAHFHRHRVVHILAHLRCHPLHLCKCIDSARREVLASAFRRRAHASDHSRVSVIFHFRAVHQPHRDRFVRMVFPEHIQEDHAVVKTAASTGSQKRCTVHHIDDVLFVQNLHTLILLFSPSIPHPAVVMPTARNVPISNKQ